MSDEATNESRRLWDSLASGYEKHRAYLNEVERPATERMLEAVGAREGDTILELTAGPGEVGLLLAERQPRVKVIISDFAPSMVAFAENAARSRGLGNAECRVIDAQAIDLPDGSVDGIMSRYGLMLVPDIPKAFAEIRRVLKPGRALAYVVWGPLDKNPWMMVMGATLMQRGHFRPPPGGGFFPLTIEEENRAAATAAGFEDVDVEVIADPQVHDSFERYWGLSSDIAGPLAVILKGLPEDERKAVHDQVEGYTQAFRSGTRMEFPACRIVVRAS